MILREMMNTIKIANSVPFITKKPEKRVNVYIISEKYIVENVVDLNFVNTTKEKKDVWIVEDLKSVIMEEINLHVEIVEDLKSVNMIK